MCLFKIKQSPFVGLKNDFEDISCSNSEPTAITMDSNGDSQKKNIQRSSKIKDVFVNKLQKALLPAVVQSHISVLCFAVEKLLFFPSFFLTPDLYSSSILRTNTTSKPPQLIGATSLSQ